MKKYLVGVLCLLYSCSGHVATSAVSNAESGTAKIKSIVSLDSAQLAAEYKKQQDFRLSAIKIKKDTLSIVTAGWYFYYPFGKFTGLKQLQGINKEYQLKKENDNTSSELAITYRLYNGNSFIKFYFEEQTDRYEIVSGKITDSNIVLLSGVKVGITKKYFFDVYFKDDMASKLPQINVVEFISAYDGIWHYYDFKNDKLTTIKFNTDYMLSKD